MRAASPLESGIHRLSDLAGKFAALLLILLVVITFADVILRYGFSSGSIAMQELEWHLYAMVFLFGISCTLSADAHVRVDIFYARQRPRTQALINMAGVLLFVLPLASLIVVHSWSFVAYSFEIGEKSPDPGGLPWTFLIKATIPFAFLLTSISAVGFFLRNLRIFQADNSGGDSRAELADTDGGGAA